MHKVLSYKRQRKLDKKYEWCAEWMEGSCVRSPRRSEGPALNVNTVKELPLVSAQ